MAKKLSQTNIQQLVSSAQKARQQAYAPYSKFRVGAALLLQNGSIVSGSNVENSSYGLTVCAERVAIVKAVSEGTKEFEAIAVVTDSTPPAFPCGVCRQFLSEFASEIPVIVANEKGDVIETNLQEIFPNQFDKTQLDSGTE